MENKLLVQVLIEALEFYEADVRFGIQPRRSADFWAKLTDTEQDKDKRALEQIAKCMRRDSTDYDCIEDILDILFELGYDTKPRHKFL